MTAPANRSLRIRNPQIRLLERLSNACAVSGDEGEVRAIVLEQIRPIADDVKIDALGNVLATRRSTKPAGKPLRVMLAAHMDEVGLMLTNDEGEGIFRFDVVGGVDPRQLAGKAIQVGRGHIPAVIGAKPIHLVDADERRHVISLDTLRVDLGRPARRPGSAIGPRLPRRSPTWGHRCAARPSTTAWESPP